MKAPKLVIPEPFIDEPDMAAVMAAQKEFQEKFGIDISPSTQELYVHLVEEEHEEWIEDYYTEGVPAFSELKELADLLYVTAGLAHQMGFTAIKAKTHTANRIYELSITELIEELVEGDANEKLLSKLIYCLYGYANQQNWDLDEAYRRVHNSNLSKLNAEGKPMRRADGKVLKGPNYKPPFLEDLTDGK